MLPDLIEMKSSFDLHKFMQNQDIRNFIVDKICNIYLALEFLNNINSEYKFTINSFVDNIPNSMLISVIMKYAMNDEDIVKQFMMSVDSRRDTIKEVIIT